MATDNRRADRHYRATSNRADDRATRRQPRPTPRRQGTRSAVIAAHLREN